MRHHPLTIVLLLLLTAGCKPTVPSQYIQPDELEELLYDYHLAEAMARVDYNSSSAFNQSKYFNAVLKKHHLTEAQFDSSMVYYFSRADNLKEIYQHVSQRLAEEAAAYGVAAGDLSRYSQYSENGDTANIWTMPTDVLLTAYPTMNRYDFTIKADSTFMVGDSFMFQFLTELIFQGGSRDAVVCVKSVYENDSTLQTFSHASLSGTSQLRIPANNTLRLKEMHGYIYLARGEETDNFRKMAFISQIQLIRFHNRALIEAHEAAERETAKADSLQRTDSAPRTAPDTLRPGATRGLRSKTVPFRRRTG